jgi:hypothetical protein
MKSAYRYYFMFPIVVHGVEPDSLNGNVLLYWTCVNGKVVEPVSKVTHGSSDARVLSDADPLQCVGELGAPFDDAVLDISLGCTLLREKTKCQRSAWRLDKSY